MLKIPPGIVLCFVELCLSIMPDVSISVQSRGVVTISVKNGKGTKENMNKTLKHYLICKRFCPSHRDRFSSVIECSMRTTPMISRHLLFCFVLIDRLLAAEIMYTIRVTETKLNQGLDIKQEKQD